MFVFIVLLRDGYDVGADIGLVVGTEVGAS